MKLKLRAVVLALIMVLGLPPLYLLTVDHGPEGLSSQAHLGNADSLNQALLNWGIEHQNNGGDHNVVLRLGWAKAISPYYTDARGTARFDLIDGSVQVEVEGLDAAKRWDVWLLDDEAADGNDRQFRLGTLVADGDQAKLWRALGAGYFDEVELDRVVVAPVGEDPEIAGLLHGTPSLFQWLHTRTRLARSLQPTPLGPGLSSILSPRPAFAQLSPTPTNDLIGRGSALFFNGTFNGNGRTCGTCHPAANNLTIDPLFISTLPKSDKLFIAEDPNFPQLAQLEKPALMRRFGVILENLDGLESPTTKFVLRGVPHTLALPTSLRPSAGDGTTVPPVERTGWSGDGSPDDGSLFFFAKGAVIQHFPLSLNRVAGVDFRLPTTNELRAMEAFQLSLGRQADLNLNAMSFKDPIVTQGVQIFNSNGRCFACHLNAGANFIADNNNRNFDTGVERQAANPIQVFDPTIPLDGGFGRLEECDLDTLSGQGPPTPGVFGNCGFNTPPLVEAADTGPFFHNNSMETIEGAVAFYNSQAFNQSPGGIASGGVALSGSEVQAVASFLRAINALENLRNAIVQEQTALTVFNRKPLLIVAIAETIDAIQVLEGASLHLNLIPELEKAIKLLNDGTDASITQAINIQKKVSANIGN